jgi:hypothetical protein
MDGLSKGWLIALALTRGNRHFAAFGKQIPRVMHNPGWP